MVKIAKKQMKIQNIILYDWKWANYIHLTFLFANLSWIFGGKEEISKMDLGEIGLTYIWLLSFNNEHYGVYPLI